MGTNLRFHWMLPKGGEVAMKTAQETSRVLTTESTSPAALPDMEGWVQFARRAEESGIESVLLSFSRYEPDTILIACAVGQATTKLKFIVAYRMGLMQPTTFVQQVNTLVGFDRRPRRLEHRRRQFDGGAARLRRLSRTR